MGGPRLGLRLTFDQLLGSAATRRRSRFMKRRVWYRIHWYMFGGATNGEDLKLPGGPDCLCFCLPSSFVAPNFSIVLLWQPA